MQERLRDLSNDKVKSKKEGILTAHIHNIGESNERRGLRCTHCGKLIIPTRKERRAKTTKQTCINCGYSSWEPCKRSIVHVENDIAENVMDGARQDGLGRRFL